MIKTYDKHRTPEHGATIHKLPTKAIIYVYPG